MEISLCMIVKNEQDTLGRCLQSVHDLVDEIIIVDTGSSDRTKEIAASYTDKIFDFIWIDDFSAARNFSFSKATKDYCMWLDADDILTEKNRIAFLELKNNLSPDVDAVLMPYHVSSMENGLPVHYLIRERIVKRSAGFQWEDEVHETLNIAGHIIKSEVVITHTKNFSNSERNFNILESVVKRGSPNLKMLYNYADELSSRMQVDEAIIYLNEFFTQGGATKSALRLNACLLLHDLYSHKQQYDKALRISLDCLEFCVDRSEFCCQLGLFYANIMNDLNEAVYWFEMALQCPYLTSTSFSVNELYYYYIPYMLLGDVYYRQSRLEDSLSCYTKALQYNEYSPEAHAQVAKIHALIFEERKNNGNQPVYDREE